MTLVSRSVCVPLNKSHYKINRIIRNVICHNNSTSVKELNFHGTPVPVENHCTVSLVHKNVIIICYIIKPLNNGHFGTGEFVR